MCCIQELVRKKIGMVRVWCRVNGGRYFKESYISMRSRTYNVKVRDWFRA